MPPLLAHLRNLAKSHLRRCINEGRRIICGLNHDMLIVMTKGTNKGTGLAVRLIFLVTIMCITAQSASADEVYTRTEIRCDETAAEFEMANYTIYDGSRVMNVERPWKKPLKNARALDLGKTTCDLKSDPPISIVISGNSTSGNIQGMCGALSGSQQFILTVNGKKIAWLSDYYRCFGSLPGRQMQDFENQMRWPTYIKINSKSITMFNSERFENGITNFDYTLMSYFLEADDTP